MVDDPLPELINIFTQLDFNFLQQEVILSLIVIIILIMCSAFVSGSEVAYFSLSPNDIENKNKNHPQDKVVLKLLKQPNLLLATILIANNFINVAIIVLFAYFSELAITFPESSSLKFVFDVIIVTSILVLLGEITPKVYANKNALLFSRMMSMPLMFLTKILYPFSFLLLKTTSLIDKKIRNRGTEASIEEISKALDLTEENSNEEEARMLKSIVEFGNTDVKEIMIPRVDTVAIEEKTKLKDVLAIIVDSGFSRIPVYKEKFDNVSGVLYIKDLIPHLEGDKYFDWTKKSRPPYFIPENKMINDLLKDFQQKKNHIAIVVDEYGGVSGIVTLEDVLEEIVGEINDEFDDDKNIYSKLDDLNFIFEGKLSLIDFIKIVKGKPDYFDDIKSDSDTIAGLILELEGKIPEIGSTTRIPPYTFIIESSDSRKIKRVKVTIDESK